MSTIAERIEAEAAAAEAEFPEPDEELAEAEEHEAEPEPEPDPEPEPPSSVTTDSDLDKRLTSEASRHEKALAKAYGDQWDARIMCPLCEAEGFLLPWQENTMPPEQYEAVKILAGDTGTPDYVPNPNWYACPTCNGYGDILTGSKRQGAELDQCPDCGGKGYRRKDFDAAQPQWAGPPPPVVPISPQVATQSGAPDTWGRDPGHPHYGIDPRYAGL
jgi:Zn ribbon nucleic-acid-binding protein